MSQPSNPLFTAPTVFQLPFTGTIKRDLAYGSGARLLDLYLPADTAAPAAVVILVTGFPEPGMRKLLGLGLREIAQYQSWARLLTASGLAAVVYGNEEPMADARAVVEFLRQQGPHLGVDPRRIGLWACSGNAPAALGLLQQVAGLRCAALLYGYLLDLDGATEVADGARQFHFANPAHGDKFVPPDVPLLVLRAGLDRFAAISRAIDAFVAEALRRNHPLTLINHAEGGHNFDLLERTAASVSHIRAVLAFLRDNLCPETGAKFP